MRWPGTTRAWKSGAGPGRGKPRGSAALGRGCQLRRPQSLRGALSKPRFASVSRKKFLKKGASQSFSKAARLKWQSLERRIIDIVMQRMAIVNLEADMERLIKVGAGLRSAGPVPPRSAATARGHCRPLRPALVPPPLLCNPEVLGGPQEAGLGGSCGLHCTAP